MNVSGNRPIGRILDVFMLTCNIKMARKTRYKDTHGEAVEWKDRRLDNYHPTHTYSQMAMLDHRDKHTPIQEIKV